MESESTTMESIPVSGVQSTVPPYVVPPTPEEEEKPLTGGEEAREEPPKVLKVRKPRAKKTAAPTIAIPDIDDKFWAGLLRTQREAERATKLQRISGFSLL